jgi:hypothetical protein
MDFLRFLDKIIDKSIDYDIFKYTFGYIDNDGRFIKHCEDSPAVERYSGEKYWYYHGVRHRICGPAVDTDVRKEWWYNGLRHREDGPAFIYMYEGHGCEPEWWYQGKQIQVSSQEEFEKHIKYFNF